VAHSDLHACTARVCAFLCAAVVGWKPPPRLSACPVPPSNRRLPRFQPGGSLPRCSRGAPTASKYVCMYACIGTTAQAAGTSTCRVGVGAPVASLHSSWLGSMGLWVWYCLCGGGELVEAAHASATLSEVSICHCACVLLAHACRSTTTYLPWGSCKGGVGSPFTSRLSYTVDKPCMCSGIPVASGFLYLSGVVWSILYSFPTPPPNHPTQLQTEDGYVTGRRDIRKRHPG
jgi:hypothetical protein